MLMTHNFFSPFILQTFRQTSHTSRMLSHRSLQRIEYKIISLTYKILNTTQPSYLYDLVSIQPPHGHNTRSSPYVTLIKPSSSLKVTHRSFRHASRHLWNQLPTSLRIPQPNYSSPSQQPSFEHADLTCYKLLSPSITFALLFQRT